MHEMALCERIVGMIAREARDRGLANVLRARLRVGKMEAFEVTQLEVCLKGMPEKALLARTTYEIDEAPVTLECASCGVRQVDDRFDDTAFAHRIAHAPEFYRAPACPKCGGSNSKIVDGKGIEVIEIE